MKAGIDEQIKKLWEALNNKSERLNLRIDTVHTLIENKVEELNDRSFMTNWISCMRLEFELSFTELPDGREFKKNGKLVGS